MEFQDIFNGVITLIVGVVGFMVHRMFRALDRLEEADRKLTKEIYDIRVVLPTDYVTKHDLDDTTDRIFRKLEKIDAKLDHKQDKPDHII